MEKQKKQNLLTAIIVILILALIMLVSSMVYEEIININKKPTQSANVPTINENNEDYSSANDINNNSESDTKLENELESEAPIEENTESENKETSAEEDKKDEYVGEEESQKQEPEITTDEKAIALVKKEWGDDNSVIFSIEKKNGNKYRIAVRDSSTTVLAWYEVNIETWKVSEY